MSNPLEAGPQLSCLQSGKDRDCQFAGDLSNKCSSLFPPFLRLVSSSPSLHEGPAPTHHPTRGQGQCGSSECPEDKDLTGHGGACGKEEGAQRGREGWILEREGRRGMKSPCWAPAPAPLQPWVGVGSQRAPLEPPRPHPIPGVPPPNWQHSPPASARQLEARSVVPASKKAGKGAKSRPWPATRGSRRTDSSRVRLGRWWEGLRAGRPQWRLADVGKQPIPAAQRGRRCPRSHSAGRSSRGFQLRVGRPPPQPCLRPPKFGLKHEGLGSGPAPPQTSG